MIDDSAPLTPPRPLPPASDSTCSSDRLPGSAPGGLVSIPGYEIKREIARGGMGRVLEAFDLVFQRDVAIKVVLQNADSPAVAGRFVRESRITGRLTHPGIPPAYQLGKLADGSPFLAMKLVRGRMLSDMLAGRPSAESDLQLFVLVFERICQAVGYAHGEGVIHRDLKPANIMVGAFGEVQVMDWGLAKDLRGTVVGHGNPPVSQDMFEASESTVGDCRTYAGAVMGTPAYMAPEQARGEIVDARADVFALGGLLSMILVSRPPFNNTLPADALATSEAGDTKEVLYALAGCRADVELVEICRRCLAIRPDDRPADGNEVATAIAEYRASVRSRERKAEHEQVAADARTPVERERREAHSAAGAILLIVITASFFLFYSGILSFTPGAPLKTLEAKNKANEEAEKAKVRLQNELRKAAWSVRGYGEKTHSDYINRAYFDPDFAITPRPGSASGGITEEQLQREIEELIAASPATAKRKSHP